MGYFVKNRLVGWETGGDKTYAELNVGDCRARDVRPCFIR